MLTHSQLGEQLTEHAVDFDRRHAIRALPTAAPNGADVEAIEARPTASSPHRSSCRLVDEAGTDARYTTDDLLAIEQTVLVRAARRTRRHRRRRPKTVER